MCSALTPAKQRVSLGASVATQEHVETILGPDNNKIHTADRTNAGVAVISWAFLFSQLTETNSDPSERGDLAPISNFARQIYLVQNR